MKNLYVLDVIAMAIYLKKKKLLHFIFIVSEKLWSNYCKLCQITKKILDCYLV